MKTQYDHWKELKSCIENQNRLLLFSSGAFFRTFDSDAKFLSAHFGLSVVMVADYEMVGFPKTSSERYFDLLKSQKFAFQIFNSTTGNLELLDSYDTDTLLKYDSNLLCFAKTKQKSKDSIVAHDFKNFLYDLSLLIQKYL